MYMDFLNFLKRRYPLKMKRIAALFATVFLLSGMGQLQVMAETSADVSKGAVKEARSQAEKEKVQVVKEALDALSLTHKVLDDLKQKNKEKALKDLEKAIGKLEIILADKSAPALLPIDSSIVAIEYRGDLDTVKATLKEVRKLLDKQQIQEARRLLDTLQSEIDIITINLPVVSYPEALKLAAKYLHEDKITEAQDVLNMALKTLVRNEMVLPIPLLKAQALVEEAEKTAKKDKKQAIKHLEAAKKELKLAEVLGYTSTSDTTYKTLHESIAKIEKEIKGKNKAEKLFDELIEKLKEFKERAEKTFSKSI